ncbi:MAG: SDR family NAD(P)-dependent oxidoreductase [Oligoflexus sp.]
MSHPSPRIHEKLVLITGASRGIGQSLANDLASRGAHLILTHRSKEGLDCTGLRSSHKVRDIYMDLSQQESIENCCNDLIGRGLVPDILINNAGTGTVELLERMDPREISKVIQVNLTAAMQLTNLFLPAMLKRGSGLIVNQASINAFIHTPLLSIYSASKAGLTAFTKSLEYELAGTGVSTLLLVTPPVQTSMFEQSSKAASKHFKGMDAKAVAPDAYARMIADAIEKQKNVLKPSGSLGAMLWMMTHFSNLQKMIFAKSFSR